LFVFYAVCKPGAIRISFFFDLERKSILIKYCKAEEKRDE